MAFLQTQGTHLYLVNNLSTEPVIVKFKFATGMTGLNGGSTDEIDVTTLDDSFRRFVLGLSDGGEAAVPFIFDPKENSHRAVFALAAAKDVDGTTACFACSDGTAAPTLDTNGNLVAPVGRTSFMVPVLVKSIPMDMAGNEVVRGSMTLRVNGVTTLTYDDGQVQVLG